MPLCRDCAYFLADSDSRDPFHYARCQNKAAGTTNPVSGNWELAFAGNARQINGACGPDGKLFEPADSEGKIPTSATTGA
jgi:hypothetical protein